MNDMYDDADSDELAYYSPKDQVSWETRQSTF
jgi:hypothetical protein